MDDDFVEYVELLVQYIFSRNMLVTKKNERPGVERSRLDDVYEGTLFLILSAETGLSSSSLA